MTCRPLRNLAADLTGAPIGTPSVTLEATPLTEMGALIAAPVAQGPPPSLDLSSVFVAAEEDNAEGADQPAVDDLTPIGGATSGSPPATPAVDEVHPRASGLEHQETGMKKMLGW